MRSNQNIPELMYAVSIQSRSAKAVATKFMLRFVAVSESNRIPTVKHLPCHNREITTDLKHIVRSLIKLNVSRFH